MQNTRETPRNQAPAEYEPRQDNRPNHPNHRGYVSWSPAGPFEDSHHVLPETQPLKVNLTVSGIGEADVDDAIKNAIQVAIQVVRTQDQ